MLGVISEFSRDFRAFFFNRAGSLSLSSMPCGGSPRVSGRWSSARVGEAGLSSQALGPSDSVPFCRHNRLMGLIPWQSDEKPDPHKRSLERARSAQPRACLQAGQIGESSGVVWRWTRERGRGPESVGAHGRKCQKSKERLCEFTHRQDLVMKNVFVLTQEQ